MIWNVSQSPGVVELALMGAPLRSATLTCLLLERAFSRYPLGDDVIENFSQTPMAARLAISGAAPAFSAVTYLLLAMDLKLMLRSAFSMSWKVSQAPTTARLAMSGFAPASSAAT